jgi:hypothetical protein
MSRRMMRSISFSRLKLELLRILPASLQNLGQLFQRQVAKWTPSGSPKFKRKATRATDSFLCDQAAQRSKTMKCNINMKRIC